MLSILIPTYNYNIFSLVFKLQKQCFDAKIEFEIICFDDASLSELNNENEKINTLEYCSFQILESNIGRSAIRNLLAKKAKFENLLFLDADTIPINNNFISTYISHLSNEEKVIYGGICYQEEKPENTQLLRWIYGNKREALTTEQRIQNPYLSLLTLNFLISKSILNKVNFNENIPNLRHEDTLFSFELKKANIAIVHIENPVYHLGIESSIIFLHKSEEAVIGLKNLIDKNLLPADYIALANYYKRLKKYRLLPIFRYLFLNSQLLLKKQLLGNSPSLIVFDLYRLGYYITL